MKKIAYGMLLSVCALCVLLLGCVSSANNLEEIVELEEFYALIYDNSFDEADKVLKNIESLYPKNRWVRHQRGKLHFLTNEIEKGMSIFSELIKKYPDWAPPYFRHAFGYAMQGNFNSALVDIDTCIRIDEKKGEGDGYAYELRGLIFFAMEKMNEAKTDFLKAVQLSDDAVDSYYHLGILRIMEEGDIDGALAYWHQAEKTDPGFIPLLRSLALGYQEKNDFNKSIEYWTKCIAQNPDYYEWYYERALVYTNINPSLAVADLTKAIECAPDFAPGYWLRGMVKKMYLHDAEGSKTDYEKALELEPQYIHNPYPDLF